MLSKSPQRHTFQIDRYIERCEERDVPINENYVDLFKTMAQQHQEQEQDPKWRENNLEYDLRSTDWILEKVRASNVYAQNLYAAMCNTRFLKMDVIPILKEDFWTCSWRYAGGIIADMRQEGDYIDWYCSGISGGDEPEVYQTGQDLERKHYVGESTVTDEIRNDLKRLGWTVQDYDD